MDQRQRDAAGDAPGHPAGTADPYVGPEPFVGSGEYGSDDAAAPEEGSAPESAGMAPRVRKAAAEKTGEIGRTAAGRTGELGRVAAEKTGEIGRTAAGRTGEFGRVAGEFGRTAAGKTGEFGRVAAGKTGELGRVAAEKTGEIGRTVARLDVPWARRRPAGVVREGIHEFALKPLISFYTCPREIGVERLERVDAPVVFVANHSSHLDAPTILRALPRRWRRRTAVAAAADYFYKSRAIANAFALVFNTIPLARRGGGLGKGSTDHVDELLEQRWNLLMFPEGTRSRDGRIGKLHRGAAVIAMRHGIPIVPIYVRGTYSAMPPGRSWPRRLPGRFVSRRHRIDICFGEPIRPSSAAGLDEMMERVRAFFLQEAGIAEASPVPMAAPSMRLPAPTDAVAQRRSRAF
jgi:1-acyl-sn-glycerol-3-phosphate acyltransferase